MSSTNKNIRRFLLFAILLTCKASLTWATNDPPLTKLLKGSKDSVHINAESDNVDIKYFTLSAAQKQLTVTHIINNLVGVGIEEENTKYIQSNFSVSVTLQITKYDNNNVITETIDKPFTINYDTAGNSKYNGLNYYSFTNAYRVIVKIISIDSGNITWPVSKVLKIENTITAARDYPFNCNTVSVNGLNVQLDITNNELTTTWTQDPNNPNPGVTEYDLEWAWIDTSAMDSYKNGNDYVQDLIFGNNATRVSITGTIYNIPLLYDDTGRIFVRVRPVQLKNDGQRIEGRWTWINNNTDQSPVSDQAVYYYFLKGHFPELNWQASTSFAEEGKRKSVVQYFDGSLRNRQTVTKDNSSNTTVVAESFYDYQGRAIIQVLPAPTLSSIIGYAHNFNKAANLNVNEEGYPKWVYDKIDGNAGACASPARPFETTTGTANYYSAANQLPAADPLKKYIPDATGNVATEAYSFTETRLAPDGRVSAQGGVGAIHQIGSNHETKYLYEPPAQEELDALFGTDAGEASHYFKNIVKDANGQYSISYTDMHGRTIATALAGSTPAIPGTYPPVPMLEPLPGQLNVEFTKQLLDDETNRVIGKSIISSKPLVVLKSDYYDFKYELHPEQLSLLACGINNQPPQPICYDCIYNLKITITSDCIGTPDFPYSVVDTNFTIGANLKDPTCNTTNPGKTATWFNQAFTRWLPEGSYMVTKILSISDSVQQIYRDSVFIKKDTCKKFMDFYNQEYQVLLAGSVCSITCESCKAAIGGGEFSGFLLKFKNESGMSEPFSAELTAQLQTSFNEAKANCDNLCKNNDGMDVIRSIEEMMLQDVTPPYGQYAKPEEIIQGTSQGYHNYNIFKTSDPTNTFYATATSTTTPVNNVTLEVFPEYSGKPDYLRPVKHNIDNNISTALFNKYYDEFDQPDISIDVLNNPPITPAQFINDFKTSWAKQLLPHHPEYRKLLITKQKLKSTYQFEADLEKDTTWLQARETEKEYITSILNKDLFFSGLGAPGAGYKNAMSLKMQNYFQLKNSPNCPDPLISLQYVSMWQVALATILCRDKSDPIDPCDVTINTNDPNTKAGCLKAQLVQPPLEHPAIPLVCETDWDWAWKVFKNLYLSERRKFISKYLNYKAPIFPGAYPNNNIPPYQLRFIDYENPNNTFQNMDIGEIGNIINSLANGGDIDGGVYQAGQLAQAQYDTVCRGYARTWIMQLEACPRVGTISHDDSLWLVTRLHKICKAGADEGHFLGSSSLKPNATGVLIEGVYYYDFPQVIKEYLATRIHPPYTNITQPPYTSECFPWIITVPPPYDKQPALANSYVLTKPDPCQCQRLTDLQTQYNSSVTQGYFSGTFSAYMAYQHGTVISQGKLDTLLALCNGSFSCKMLPVPFSIPPALQCRGNAAPPKTCIDCKDYKDIKDAFFIAFGIAAPILHPQTAEQVSLNQAFARFANYKTGFVKNWTDYAAFGDSCNTFNPPISCNDLNAALQEFYLSPAYLQMPIGNSCVQAFVQFFNTRFNKVLTYQEWMIMFRQCGPEPDVCKVIVTCESFNALIDEFYNIHTVLIYSNPGCQTVFKDFINSRLNSDFSYAQLDAIYNYTCKGGCGLNVCIFPNHFLLTRVYNAFKVAHNGHPWELPDCKAAFVLFFNNYFSLTTALNYGQIENYYNSMSGETNNCTPDLNDLCNAPYTCDELTRILDEFISANNPVSELPDCEDAFAAYFNHAMHKQYTYAEIEILYLGICHIRLAVCETTADCERMIALVSEFLEQNQGAMGIDCQNLFMELFNGTFATNYTNFDVLKLRYLSCGFDLNICGTRRSITADAASLNEFLAAFRNDYPDPATQFSGNECQNVFTARFNEQFNSGALFDEITAYYLLNASVVLDVCDNRCSRITVFITNFNSQFSTLKLPTAAREDLFTAAYNKAFVEGARENTQFASDSTNGMEPAVVGAPDPRAFNPIVNFQDILNAITDCGITGFTLEPVGTISINDPQVLLSLKQVYYVIHPNGMVADCETDFAAWFNRVMETYYAYEELLVLYNTVCGNNAGYVCSSPTESEEETRFAIQLVAQPIGPNIIGKLAPVLCGLNHPSNGPVIIPNDDPCKDLIKIALNSALEKYELYVDSLRNVFDLAYRSKCLAAKNLESFTVKYKRNEYHYTLYYYDQAGNLVKTVPPAGVDARHSNTDFLNHVKAARTRVKNGQSEAISANIETPTHTLVTEYRYNTLNQVVAQKTPDAGISNFWYDRLGRLVVSQNAKQQTQNKYSYTLYDPLGRIQEVGQKPQAANSMDPATSRSLTAFATWFTGGGIKEQMTITVYDNAYTPLQTNTAANGGFYQKNLRNRVSYSFIKNTDSNDPYYSWNAATLYSYDIHGNVDTLLQDYGSSQSTLSVNGMNSAAGNASGNRWKRMVYEYDLISGKVNQVAYQPGQLDAFYHRYSYDAENRLTDVETSSDKLVWYKDARYNYYKHGPLARTILGQNQVQGIDYAYTLQGWIKGVNATSVGDGKFDMGGDGLVPPLGGGGGNSNIARDVFGYSLNYFGGDYKPIGGASADPFTGGTFGLTGTGGDKVANELFNGNIAAMFVNIPKLGNAQLYGYKYDQLNRIKNMDAFEGFNNATNSFTTTAQPTSAYKETISYDPNGNIKHYLRNGDAARLPMDNMIYTYKPGTNQLDKVVDGAADVTTNYDKYNDIKQGQTNGNYQYDAIGNLTSDISEGISNIEWSVYGKITKIEKTNGTQILYTYDPSGNRISKSVKTCSDCASKTTYYVRDASGNSMGLYTKDAAVNNNSLTQTEVHLYGSSRLGILNTNIDMQVQPPVNTNGNTIFTTGNKFFELSNMLGNVVATISDRKLQHSSDGITVDYYNADVVTANSFYVFGMLMPEKKYQASATSSYRYGLNGQEKSTEINENSYTAEFWEYDSRIGRRFNLDPKPNTSISPYVAFENNPIWFGDPLGDSIVDPNRTRAVNVYIVGKNRDKTNDMSAKRLQKTAEKNPENSIYIESDQLDKSTADEIIKRLGADGYVKTLVIDYHRSDYDEKMPDKENFYSSLANGYAGQPTQVLAGMCWAGGGAEVNGNPHINLTRPISKSLDNATVYGLKTEAGNLPFRMFGNFGSISPDVVGSGKVSKWERKYRTTWAVTSYNSPLKQPTTIAIKAKIKLSLEGTIHVKIKKEVTDAENQ